ncbi:hypothetical protein FPHOBKDP_00202 [Listeria phage LPJP1]|nr:hypothetical protein FPHOBKDP_00202 [Listeria phage LPJP1]
MKKLKNNNVLYEEYIASLYKDVLSLSQIDSEIYNEIKIIEKLHQLNIGIGASITDFKLEHEILFLHDKFGKKRMYKMIKLIKDWYNNNLDNKLEPELFDIQFVKYKKKNGLYRMFNLFSYEQLMNILNKCVVNNISIHRFVSEFPNKVTNKYITNKKVNSNYIDEAYNFLQSSLSKYNNDKFIKLLPFMNYEVIRKSDLNYKEMNKYINNVLLARAGTKYNVSESKMNISNNHSNKFIYFSKDVDEIMNIGVKTKCCFTPNGLAAPLVKISLENPLAGILTGYMGKKIWFSFVWEIGIFNQETKTIDICLIMDNIESNQLLNNNDFSIISDWITNNTHYKKIFLGYLRNDINRTILEDKCYFDRPHTLINSEHKFSSYNYDDSEKIYELDIIPDYDDTLYIQEERDIGWIMRSLYYKYYDIKLNTFLEKGEKVNKLFIARNSCQIFSLIFLDNDDNIITTLEGKYYKELSNILKEGSELVG